MKKHEERKQVRVGRIHHIWHGDETISIEKDISNKKSAQTIAKFETLEKDIDDFITLKYKEFEEFLADNGLYSSMGWVCKK